MFQIMFGATGVRYCLNMVIVFDINCIVYFIIYTNHRILSIAPTITAAKFVVERSFTVVAISWMIACGTRVRTVPCLSVCVAIRGVVFVSFSTAI